MTGAIIITFVSAVASIEEEPVPTAIQQLWINIITDTFTVLAANLISRSLLNRKPDTYGTQPLTADVIKMILGWSIHRVITILGLDHSEHNNEVVTTLRSTPLFSPRFSTRSIPGDLIASSISSRVPSRTGFSSRSLLPVRLARTFRITSTLILVCRNRQSGHPPHLLADFERVHGQVAVVGSVGPFPASAHEFSGYLNRQKPYDLST